MKGVVSSSDTSSSSASNGEIKRSKSSVKYAQQGAGAKVAVKSSQRSVEYKKPIIYNELISSMLTEDPASAYAWLIKQKSSINEIHYNVYKERILLSWAKHDPEAVERMLNNKSSNDADKETWIRALGKGWADKDVNGAFEWLESPELQDVSNEVMFDVYSDIMMKYSELDPVASAQIIGEIQSNDMQLRLIGPLIESYTKHNSKDAVDWLLKLESDEVRNLAMEHVIDEVKGGESVEILSLVMDNKNQLSSDTISSVFAKAAMEDPQLAASRLSDVKDADLKSVVSLFTSSWLASDSAAVAEWLETNPTNRVYEIGAETLATNIAVDEPLEAIEWARSISSENSRASLFSHIVAVTENERIDEVDDYFKKVNMTANERETLQGKIDLRLNELSSSILIPGRF